MPQQLRSMFTHRRYTTGEQGFGAPSEPADMPEQSARPRTMSCIEPSVPRMDAVPSTCALSSNFEVMSLNNHRRSRRSSNVGLSQTSGSRQSEFQPHVEPRGQLPVNCEIRCIDGRCEHGGNCSRTTDHAHPKPRGQYLNSSIANSSNYAMAQTAEEQSGKRERQMNVLLSTGTFQALLRAIIDGNAQVAVSNAESSSTNSEMCESVCEQYSPLDIIDKQQVFQGQVIDTKLSLQKLSTSYVTKPINVLTNTPSDSAPSWFIQQNHTTASSGFSRGSAIYGKRKHTEGNGEDEDIPDQSKRDQRSEPTSKLDSGMVHGFACHFNQYNSEKYCEGSNTRSSYKACTNRFSSTAKIEQHFKEVHFYGEYYCPRCVRNLGGEEEFEAHMRSQRLCAILPREVIEDELYLVRGSQRRKNLKALGKKSIKVTAENRWKQMWRAIFPEVDCPSPYRASSQGEYHLEQGLAAALPNIVHAHFAPTLELDPSFLFASEHDQMLDYTDQFWSWFRENEALFNEMLENATRSFPSGEEEFTSLPNLNLEQLPDLSGLGDSFETLAPTFENSELSTLPPMS